MHYVGKTFAVCSRKAHVRLYDMDFIECAQIRIKFDTRAGHMAETEFETDSSVHGYHVYQDNWTPVIGERLHCER